MALTRMNRDEFFAKLADLGEDGTKKALWNRCGGQLGDRLIGHRAPFSPGPAAS